MCAPAPCKNRKERGTPRSSDSARLGHPPGALSYRFDSPSLKPRLPQLDTDVEWRLDSHPVAPKPGATSVGHTQMGNPRFQRERHGTGGFVVEVECCSTAVDGGRRRSALQKAGSSFGPPLLGRSEVRMTSGKLPRKIAPSTSLRIVAAGSRCAHARKAPQVKPRRADGPPTPSRQNRA